jgi:hypothetical protein
MSLRQAYGLTHFCIVSLSFSLKNAKEKGISFFYFLEYTCAAEVPKVSCVTYLLEQKNG